MHSIAQADCPASRLRSRRWRQEALCHGALLHTKNPDGMIKNDEATVLLIVNYLTDSLGDFVDHPWPRAEPLARGLIEALVRACLEKNASATPSQEDNEVPSPR